MGGSIGVELKTALSSGAIGIKLNLRDPAVLNLETPEQERIGWTFSDRHDEKRLAGFGIEDVVLSLGTCCRPPNYHHVERGGDRVLSRRIGPGQRKTAGVVGHNRRPGAPRNSSKGMVRITWWR